MAMATAGVEDGTVAAKACSDEMGKASLASETATGEVASFEVANTLCMAGLTVSTEEGRRGTVAVDGGQEVESEATEWMDAVGGLSEEREDQSLPRRNLWSSSMRSEGLESVDLV